MTAIQALSTDAPAGYPTAGGEIASRAYLDQVHSTRDFPASGNGWLGWTIDPACTGTLATTSITSSRVSYTKFWLPRGVTATGAGFLQSSTVGTASGFSGLAIFSDGATATRLAMTASTPSAFNAGPALRKLAFTSTVALSAGYYWLAWLCVGTTQPKIYGAGRQQNGPMMNAVAKRVGYIDTSVTAIPTTFTVASLTDWGYNTFMGIY